MIRYFIYIVDKLCESNSFINDSDPERCIGIGISLLIIVYLTDKSNGMSMPCFRRYRVLVCSTCVTLAVAGSGHTTC